MKKVIIQNRSIKKLKGFYPWVFDNEIEKIPSGIYPGEIVEIHASNREFLGIGYINPKSKITVRVLSFQKETIGKEFFKRAIERAIEKRNAIKNSSDAFRAVYSESDGLPGLIVDKYGEYLSVQINTAGMENVRKSLIESLVELTNPKGIYEKSDSYSREKEGLKTEDKVICGDIPESIIFTENNIRFAVDLRDSHKTGFYLDQRENRKIVSSCVEKGFSVLDVFSNTGGFGLYAARHGAAKVTLIDSSASALKQAAQNAKLNSISSIETIEANAFDFLREDFAHRNKYDLIVLDPPAFTRTNQAKAGALRGMKDLMVTGLRLLKEKGYIAIFSCSQHISAQDLVDISFAAAGDRHTRLEVVRHLYQDADHPHILNIPHSLYLKGLLFRKTE